ncbi:molecular chaperone DnaJ, partial [Leptospira ognonensis]
MALVRRETHYEILGLDRNASASLVQRQFLELQSFWEALAIESPFESELKLIEIQNAFSILSDPNLKQTYDETLDFEFVLLDGKTKDVDIEEAYEIYRQNQPKTYQEILKDFQKFK